jgi:hypothetical protein
MFGYVSLLPAGCIMAATSDNISQQVWIELLRAASHFQVPALQLISEKVLVTHLSPQNMNDMLALAQETGSVYLKDQTSHYIDHSQHLRSNSKTIVSSMMPVGRGSYDGTSGDEPPPAPPRLIHMGVPEPETGENRIAYTVILSRDCIFKGREIYRLSFTRRRGAILPYRAAAAGALRVVLRLGVGHVRGP